MRPKEYNVDETCTSPFIALHCFLSEVDSFKKSVPQIYRFCLINAASVTMIRKAKNNAFMQFRDTGTGRGEMDIELIGEYVARRSMNYEERGR